MTTPKVHLPSTLPEAVHVAILSLSVQVLEEDVGCDPDEVELKAEVLEEEA